MAAYRVYRLDGLGKFRAGDWIEAASDDDALRIAADLDDCPPCEIWDRDRYVGKIGYEQAH